jgi:hypothetical protein
MTKTGTLFFAHIPLKHYEIDHVHDIDVDLSKHRDRCRSIETSRSKWLDSIQTHHDLEVEEVQSPPVGERRVDAPHRAETELERIRRRYFGVERKCMYRLRARHLAA